LASLLVNITNGPEHPFRAALGLLVAKTALAEGHDVTVFLAGDAVQLIRDAVLDNLVGLGSGSAREHYDAIAAGGGKFYLSGMSSKGRGVTEADIEGKPAEFVMPDVLVRLAMESDKTLVY
jgi:predicted peroxiredoxin